MDSTQQPGGTIVRGDDGTIYFLRNELLEMAKVTEPEMAAFCAQVLEENAPETEGFALTSGSAISSLSFSGPLQTTMSFDASRVASTIMCPGTFKPGSYSINPAFRTGF